eukprot:6194958-Pleurochrysis_carterae.AAC.1
MDSHRYDTFNSKRAKWLLRQVMLMLSSLFKQFSEWWRCLALSLDRAARSRWLARSGCELKGSFTDTLPTLKQEAPRTSCSGHTAAADARRAAKEAWRRARRGRAQARRCCAAARRGARLTGRQAGLPA